MTNYVMKEGLLDDIGSAVNLKKGKNLQKALRTIMVNNAMMKDILDNPSKDIAKIVKTQGIFSKYEGFKDIEKIVKFFKRGLYTVTNGDVSAAVTIIDGTLSILSKYEKDFNSGFRKDNPMVKNIYVAYAAGVILATLTLNSKGLKEGEDGVLRVTDDSKSGISTDKVFTHLAGLNKKDLDGSLAKIFKTQKDLATKKLNEDSDVEGSNLEQRGANWIFTTLHNIIQGYVENGAGGEKIKNLWKFLEALRKNDGIDKVKGNSLIKGFQAVIILFSIIAILAVVVAIGRFLVSLAYSARIKLADSLREGAEMLDAAANNTTDGQRKEKMESRAKTYRRWADKVDIDITSTETKVDRTVRSIDEKIEKEAKQDEPSNSNGLDFGI